MIDHCDSVVAETGFVDILQGRNEFDLGDSLTIRCQYSNTIMDQPPAWWYQESTDSDYTRIRSFNPNYRINSSFDQETCSFTSYLTVEMLSFSLAGVYSCFHNTAVESISVNVQGIVIVVGYSSISKLGQL